MIQIGARTNILFCAVQPTFEMFSILNGNIFEEMFSISPVFVTEL